MSFTSRQYTKFPIYSPERAYAAEEQLTSWRARSAAPIAPLDIEAAVALPRVDKGTWTGCQSSDTLWEDTAVEASQGNSFFDYDDDSKSSKSVATSKSAATSLHPLHPCYSGHKRIGKFDEKAPPVPPLPTPEGPLLSFPRQVALIAVCCSAQFLNLAGMNQTVASVMILSHYFDIRDYGTLSWFSAAYSMSVGTFILPAGRLGDMYGHKRIFILGWTWFALWSFITGFSYTSSNIILFSVCRAFQGIGPALLVPNAIAILARNFAVGNPRNTAFACFGAAGPTGATAGAVFTAVVAQLSWWPWCFWILSAVCLLVAALAVFIVPGAPADLFKSSRTNMKLTFDYWGFFTGVCGLVLVNLALNQAPLVGWTTWYIPSLLILGSAFLWTFVIVELNFTADPLIPIRGLGKDAYFALGCIAAGWGSHGIWAYYLYLFLEQVKGHSALLSSAMTSPVAVTGILFALSSVWLVKHIGVAWTMFVAMTNFLIGSLLIGTVPLHQTYWAQVFLSIIIMPGAMNLSFPSATMLLSSALPKEKQGIAASLVSTLVNYCISCGLGLAGSIHRQFFERAARNHNIALNPTTLPPLTEEGDAINAARIESFRGPWIFACALSAMGVFIAAAFIFRTQAVCREKPTMLREWISLRLTL
ncbi:uncharacterized protein PV09_02241 [Verruconis gallopava]|uniref:Major facilitator superfamily (MFS) profile domain-containing protein n=1 Tax=Verruconis gallopava TaxID=253628 RepID=A0A0D2AKP0_9PEZI|nr:uncharacterized protein PV09_02241 [Verruconis gallopava]KIW07398.1 hypothetical protein PV09_02241 [Verruconis gallopava]